MASIAWDDALIVLHRANPAGSNFRERQEAKSVFWTDMQNSTWARKTSSLSFRLAAKPSPKRQASAEPQSPPESPTPPLLSGAAPTLPTGSFDNRVGSRR
jgi:hypothetical protein